MNDIILYLKEDVLSSTEILKLWNAQGASYVLAALLILLIAKMSFKFFSNFDFDKEISEKDNKAVAVSFVGFWLAVSIVICGSLSSETKLYEGEFVLWMDLLSTVIWGVFGIALLYLSRFINDKLLLKDFDNRKEVIEDRNVGTAAVELGSYISSALIIAACFSGDDYDVVEGIFSTLLFYFLGQIFFLLFASVYRRLLSFNIHDEIEKDNYAAGISYGLNFVAISIFISSYIRVSDSVTALCVWFLLSIVVLISCRYLVDKILLPKSSLDHEIVNDRNWGAAILEGSSAIIVALIASISFLA